MTKSEMLYRSLFGFALADAYGVPFEFEPRYYATLHNMNKSMVGYGSHCQPPGTWSDDTSMVLATMDILSSWDTLIDLKKGEFDEELLHNLMEAFKDWRYNGRYGCYGECFDLGFTTDTAIKQYEQNRNPRTCGQAQEFNCGNGSLMRIFPLAYLINQLPHYKRYNWCDIFSSLTHAHPLTSLCSFFYLEMYLSILDGSQLNVAIEDAIEAVKIMRIADTFRTIDLGKCSRILKNELKGLEVSEIKSTGYVVDTLEAVIWCLAKGTCYQSSVHLAITLGNDTDTIAALVGAIAAIIYKEPFPLEWMEELKNTDLLVSIAAKFNAIYCENAGVPI
jgi:ADP-ribosylglycohydrolase